MSVFSSLKLSIENFIGDIPRIVNTNFEKLDTILNRLITSANDNEKVCIECKDISATSLSAETIAVTTFKINYKGDTKIVSADKLYEALKKYLNETTEVSAEKLSER